MFQGKAQETTENHFALDLTDIAFQKKTFLFAKEGFERQNAFFSTFKIRYRQQMN